MYNVELFWCSMTIQSVLRSCWEARNKVDGGCHFFHFILLILLFLKYYSASIVVYLASKKKCLSIPTRKIVYRVSE